MSVRFVSSALIAGATLAISVAASAQAQQDPTKMMYESGQNQLGILEYCKSAGYADTSVIDTQKKLMAMMPKPSDTSGGTAAYNSGKAGTVMSGGQTVKLADSAKAQGSTEQAFCTQISSAIKQAGAQLPK